ASYQLKLWRPTDSSSAHPQNRLDSAKNDYISHELVTAASPSKYGLYSKELASLPRETHRRSHTSHQRPLCQHFARVSIASPPLTRARSLDLAKVYHCLTLRQALSFARVNTADVLSAMARCTSFAQPDPMAIISLVWFSSLASSTLA
ncbi:unnamed protein product, partial [Trichogramma brassicae]